MKKRSLRERNRIVLAGIHILLLAVFLVGCNYDQLAADYKNAAWESFSIRIILSFSLSLFAGFRLNDFLRWRTSTDRKNSLLVVVFLAVLFYPVFSQVSFVTSSVQKVASHIWRKQQQKDAGAVLNLFREFPSIYTKYRGRHFKLSKNFIYLDGMVKVYLLGVSPNSSVALGKKGFFFEGYGARKVEKGIVEQFDNLADYMGQIPFSEEDLKQWKRTLEERRYWLQTQGSDFVFVLAPTKSFVYTEFMPDKLKARKGVSRYTQLSDYLEAEADIHFVDLLPALLEAKEARSYPHLFYKTDFHWNFYGAFIAYEEIVSSLRGFFPQYIFNDIGIDDFELDINEHWAHTRFMDMVRLPPSIHKNEHYITMVPKPGNILSSVADLPEGGIRDHYPPKRKITNSQGKSMAIPMVLNPQANIPSVLLLGDSFFEKCVYFFSAQFKRVLNYRTIVNFPATILQYEKPNIVIQEVLNMYVLREPPVNPRFMQIAYLRYKFREGEESVYLETKERAMNSGIGRHVSLPLPPIENTDGKKTIICKISLQAEQKGKMVVRLTNGAGGDVAHNEHPVAAGNNDLYIEMPSVPVSTVLLSWKDADITLPDVTHLELRTVSSF